MSWGMPYQWFHILAERLNLNLEKYYYYYYFGVIFSATFFVSDILFSYLHNSIESIGGTPE